MFRSLVSGVRRVYVAKFTCLGLPRWQGGAKDKDSEKRFGDTYPTWHTHLWNALLQSSSALVSVGSNAPRGTTYLRSLL